jgi:hypothetical protein
MIHGFRVGPSNNPCDDEARDCGHHSSSESAEANHHKKNWKPPSLVARALRRRSPKAGHENRNTDNAADRADDEDDAKRSDGERPMEAWPGSHFIRHLSTSAARASGCAIEQTIGIGTGMTFDC